MAAPSLRLEQQIHSPKRSVAIITTDIIRLINSLKGAHVL